MNELVKIALMLLQHSSTRAAPEPRRLLRPMMLNIMIAFCLGGVVILAFVALWHFLLPMLGPALTPLILAGVLLIFALTGLVVKRTTMPRPPNLANTPPPISLALDEAARVFNNNKLTMLSVALLAGVAFAYSEKNARKGR